MISSQVLIKILYCLTKQDLCMDDTCIYWALVKVHRGGDYTQCQEGLWSGQVELFILHPKKVWLLIQVHCLDKIALLWLCSSGKGDKTGVPTLHSLVCTDFWAPTIALRLCKDVDGIHWGGPEFKVSLYADYLLLYVFYRKGRLGAIIAYNLLGVTIK